MKVQCQVELDPADYGFICPAKDVPALKKALNSLYANIWIEACYDSYNNDTKRICHRLLDDIREVNRILEFKK